MNKVRGRGFTLLELLVVMVITVVLAAIASPAYSSYVTRARRVEAQAHMLALLQIQERHFSQAYTYIAFSSSDPADPKTRLNWWLGPTPEESAYEFAATRCIDQTLKQCIAIVAMPGTDKVRKSFRDDECGKLTATSLGERHAERPNKACWP